MNKKIHSLVYSLFSKIHIYPAKLTPQEDVLKLIKKLRPVNTDKPLIRLGPKGDGGYLIPDDLEGIMGPCFSPGVDKICGFEKDCAEKGIKVFMADYSVNKPPEENIHFNFNKKFIGLPKSFEFLSMDEWVKENSLDSNSDLMLQMDIEGYEYEAFFGMSQSLLQRFRIIIVEFHFLNKLFISSLF